MWSCVIIVLWGVLNEKVWLCNIGLHSQGSWLIEYHNIDVRLYRNLSKVKFIFEGYICACLSQSNIEIWEWKINSRFPLSIEAFWRKKIKINWRFPLLSRWGCKRKSTTVVKFNLKMATTKCFFKFYSWQISELFSKDLRFSFNNGFFFKFVSFPKVGEKISNFFDFFFEFTI